MIRSIETAFASLPTMLFFVLSGANLTLIAMVSFYGKKSDAPASKSRGAHFSAGLSLVSQLLYLGLFAAWIFRWIRFYPGNPVAISSIIVGMILSVSAFLLAFLARGFQRTACIAAALACGLLWLFAAMASVAV